MKLYLLCVGVIVAPFLWLAASLALARWRGRQLARWMREHEGREFVDRDCRRINGRRVNLWPPDGITEREQRRIRKIVARLPIKWEAEP